MAGLCLDSGKSEASREGRVARWQRARWRRVWKGLARKAGIPSCRSLISVPRYSKVNHKPLKGFNQGHNPFSVFRDPFMVCG